MTEGAEHGAAARIFCGCATLWILNSDGLTFQLWWGEGSHILMHCVSQQKLSYCIHARLVVILEVTYPLSLCNYYINERYVHI
ncbi:hypothetical protein PAHAL_9G361000 [Panicum hallii]|uniref:Uncharacterized protein n=1 Tax=Panicum hallii TaxID=206008 RepID=A0A2T8I3M0_9POAL|nr:hypothetical protein PAHAL_9G361000 [Panicum hallii]